MFTLLPDPSLCCVYVCARTLSFVKYNKPNLRAAQGRSHALTKSAEHYHSARTHTHTHTCGGGIKLLLHSICLRFDSIICRVCALARQHSPQCVRVSAVFAVYHCAASGAQHTTLGPPGVQTLSCRANWEYTLCGCTRVPRARHICQWRIYRMRLG
jgi:hypothetical protein